MKKYFSIVLLLVCTAILTSCQKAEDIIRVDFKEIEKVEMLKEDKIYSSLDKEDKIKEFLEYLNKNSRKTSKESVNDQPTNIDKYITIKIKYKDSNKNNSTIYYYVKNNASYLEQPYRGIWKINKYESDPYFEY